MKDKKGRDRGKCSKQRCDWGIYCGKSFLLMCLLWTHTSFSGYADIYFTLCL